jgi:CDP-paratose 2-epimerase
MSVAIVTGSAGLVGSEAARFFDDLGFEVVGIDNDMRARFFGAEASTQWNRKKLERDLRAYQHVDLDIRDETGVDTLFKRLGSHVAVVIHTAAQPSHDWAAREPLTDFSVNATGTLILLEAVRSHAPDAVFVFVSTNKVYGDTPNRLPLVERETRFEIMGNHPYADGIDESMSIDGTMHSLFGASKVAADVMVQEYGRYFGMKTGVFRGGCLTGSGHSGTQLHGFLAYLMQCTATGRPYSVFGYKGKQVRDNIHSRDLIRAFYEFYLDPRPGEAYNMGGGRKSNCSIMEAIALCEKIAGRELRHTYVDVPRRGDHIWWISGLRKFQQHYPGWQVTFDVPAILEEMFESNLERWSSPVR